MAYTAIFSPLKLFSSLQLDKVYRNRWVNCKLDVMHLLFHRNLYPPRGARQPSTILGRGELRTYTTIFNLLKEFVSLLLDRGKPVCTGFAYGCLYAWTGLFMRFYTVILSSLEQFSSLQLDNAYRNR